MATVTGLRPSGQGVSYCLGFAHTALYDALPRMRDQTRKNEDIDFTIKTSTLVDQVSKSIVIRTYRKRKAPSSKAMFSAAELNLTQKMAGLLAVDVLDKYNSTTAEAILTPLSGALFKLEDVKEEVAKLVAIGRHRSIEPSTIANMLNASTMTGGHILPRGDASVAAASVISTTMGIADKLELRMQIVKKVLRGYVKEGKEPKQDDIMGWMTLCNGGIPASISLAELFDGRKHSDNIPARQRDTAIAGTFQSYRVTDDTGRALQGTGHSVSGQGADIGHDQGHSSIDQGN